MKGQGNSTGHFKGGIIFVKKDKDAIENVRGNETSNSAKHTETMDIDAFPVLSNGLQSIGGGGMSHPVKMIDAIDNIGNAIDAGYEANEQVNKKANTEVNKPKKSNVSEYIYTNYDSNNSNNNVQVRNPSYDSKKKKDEN